MTNSFIQDMDDMSELTFNDKLCDPREEEDEDPSTPFAVYPKLSACDWKFPEFTGLRRFAADQKFVVLTVRFTTDTLALFRERIQQTGGHGRYCVPRQITTDVLRGIICIVLEMNVTTNQIVGIGYIINEPGAVRHTYQITGIQPSAARNRFNYRADRRIDRSQMTDTELEFITYLEGYCFFGKTNLKRATGLSLFPIRLIYTLQAKYRVKCHELFAPMFNTRMPHK